MKTVLKLLRKELKEWKAEHVDNEIHFKFNPDKYNNRDLKHSKIHVAELEQAIEILKSQ